MINKAIFILMIVMGARGVAAESYCIHQTPTAFLPIEGLTGEIVETNADEFYYVIKQVLENGKWIELEDRSQWQIGSQYTDTVKKWQAGQRLKLTDHHQYSNSIQFENIDSGEEAWGVNSKKPENKSSHFILRLSNSVFDPADQSKIILENGSIFKGPRIRWKVREEVFIFHSKRSGFYEMWNLFRNERSTQWELVGNEKEGSAESIFNIEKQLNHQVLGQQEVIKTLSSTLFNCWAGLNDPQLPLGVFLFLGPTGVGKTELAKALTKELYKKTDRLIRFDMSQFPTQYDYTRLIGSPPGYVNHQEGGQLTEAIKAQPVSIVLLDEMEKAHPMIRKAFLPIFDEGYIVDSKNIKVPCNRVIFIMTGNICSEEIATLFNQGYETDEVIKMIEPHVIAQLSPELYNRVTTLVFRPITPEIMEGLVDQKMHEVVKQLKSTKNINLVMDQSVKTYLIKKGYHPTLGARPLKRLIQSKVVAFLSFAIIEEGIPEGSTITLFYSEDEDRWNLEWKAKE